MFVHLFSCIHEQVKLMLQDSHPAINQFLEDLSLQPVRSPVDQPLPPLPTLGDAPTRSVIERMPVPGPQDLEGQMDLLRRLAQVCRSKKFTELPV